MLNFISTGGLGDAFIVALKLQNMSGPWMWRHIESNDISQPFKDICSLFDFPRTEFIHDPKYIQNIEEYRKLGIVIPVPVVGICNFHKCEWPLSDTFLKRPNQKKKYDVVLQCSAGANKDRDWLIDPIMMAKAIESTGRDVTIVGSDDRFESSRQGNLVNKTSLFEAFEIIEKCETFIGLSGLLNLFACASKIKNIHLIESEKHEEMYYSEKWREYTTGIRIEGLQSVLTALKLRI